MEKERLEQLKQLKQECKEKNKGKNFATMSAKEKYDVLEVIAKMLGLVD